MMIAVENLVFVSFEKCMRSVLIWWLDTLFPFWLGLRLGSSRVMSSLMRFGCLPDRLRFYMLKECVNSAFRVRVHLFCEMRTQGFTFIMSDWGEQVSNDEEWSSPTHAVGSSRNSMDTSLLKCSQSFVNFFPFRWSRKVGWWVSFCLTRYKARD